MFTFTAVNFTKKGQGQSETFTKWMVFFTYSEHSNLHRDIVQSITCNPLCQKSNFAKNPNLMIWMEQDVSFETVKEKEMNNGWNEKRNELH